MPNDAPTAAARDELTSRVLPQMVFSDASNPLTAPLKAPEGLSPDACSQRRFSIEGNAIVTGGSGYLALTAIRALLEHGASGISILDVGPSLSKAETGISQLRQDFPQSTIIAFEVDVRDPTLVESVVKRTVEKLGSVDMLLCFAGVVGTAHAHEYSLDEWKRLLDINTTGSWICAQAVGKQMIHQGTGGSILFIASISAHHVNFPQPQVAYNVSKAGILQMARSLAAEWARFGIRVNSISPGYMDTILNHGAGLDEGRNIWASRNPMGRMGDPEELTGPVVLLSSKVAGRYITGTDIMVDGTPFSGDLDG
ncbi:NAD(P)-binding protein [Dendrothele bispora CBS 962.96]|uniref:NAD(P)-binding protein n=1 Tax=Dendrothele bispora (strain CBS 962.96) TaxID=1314807 RepID=A0A4S8MGW9_DENBC|nr:NAD(P)-binding protein [Dendrothele bispora CBS 962.96]